MYNSFYSGKRVLVTGHTGFKGGWLSLWLKNLGAVVSGVSLPAPTQPNLHSLIQKHVFTTEIECDIRDRERLATALKQLRPEVVFHMAAQPLVRESYVVPIETLEINAVGTANLLEAIRQAELNCVVIIITTDKCYENREWEFAYRENDPLGGHDVYSMSKAAAELIAQAWNRSFFRTNPKLGPVATVRAGNVIGGGDYAQDRIVPDCVRALLAKKPILVRNPGATRPWQHVLECLSGYLWLAARLSAEPKNSPLAGAFNFGPEPSACHDVRSVVEEFLKVWPGEWVDGSDPANPHEATRLSLAIDRAATLLEWYPSWDFQEAIRRTAAWYYARHVKDNADLLAFSLKQISDYCAAARSKNLAWAQAA